jgi:hypothetical protein
MNFVFNLAGTDDNAQATWKDLRATAGAYAE